MVGLAPIASCSSRNRSSLSRNFQTIRKVQRRPTRSSRAMIDRTTARLGCEYEWGIHIALFAERVRFTDEHVAATVAGPGDAACCTPEEQALITLVDDLVDRRAIVPATWAQLATPFDETQIL